MTKRIQYKIEIYIFIAYKSINQILSLWWQQQNNPYYPKTKFCVIQSPTTPEERCIIIMKIKKKDKGNLMKYRWDEDLIKFNFSSIYKISKNIQNLFYFYCFKEFCIKQKISLVEIILGILEKKRSLCFI